MADRVNRVAPLVMSGVRRTLAATAVSAICSVGVAVGSAAAVSASTEALTSVSCVKSACVVVGSSNPSGGSAVIARSSNGGHTWKAQIVPSGIAELNGVFCTSNTACKAVGETSTGSPVIVTSPVTGNIWYSESAPAADGDLLAIACSSTTECWAGGYSSGFVAGAIAETTNGGTTWTPESVPGGPSGVAEVTGLSCTKGTTPIHCYATGNWSNYGQAPYLMKSTSKVKYWSDVTLPKPNGISGTLEGGHCFSGASCVFVGNDPSYYILNTTNGGMSFTIEPAPTGVNGLSSISCAGKTGCEAVGTGQGGVAAIIRSTNGGVTWSAQTPPTGIGALSSVSCSSALHCVAVGQAAAGGPAVLVTTDGGAVWTSVTPPS